MADDTIQRDIHELRETVFGNGQEGLKTKMTRLELGLNTIMDDRAEIRLERQGMRRDIRNAVYAVVGAAAFAVITFFVNQYMLSMRAAMLETVVNTAVTKIQKSNDAAAANRDF